MNKCLNINSLAILIVILNLIHRGSAQIDYRLTPYANCGPTTPIECTVGGPLCETCTSLVVCEKINGVWQKEPVKTCDSPYKCVAGACTTNEDAVCDGTACLAFKCDNPGIYPDPFFCNKYVMCVNVGTSTKPVLQPYLTECDAGFVYNVATGTCDLVESKCAQPYPVPLCTSAGQSAALVGNKTYYYICQQYSEENNVLYPALYRCEGDKVYENYQCVARAV